MRCTKVLYEGFIAAGADGTCISPVLAFIRIQYNLACLLRNKPIELNGIYFLVSTCIIAALINVDCNLAVNIEIILQVP